MQKYIDSQNREWDLEITVETLDRLRANGIDMLDIESFVGRLQDPVFSTKCLYWACYDQATERNIDFVAFKKSFRGDFVEKGKEALLAEFVDFFPTSRQPLIRSALDRATLVIQKIADIATREAESFDADASAKTIWEKMKAGNPPEPESEE